jgi:hypothetical protein
MKDGTPITTIFAKYMTNLIDALTMNTIYYPSRFKAEHGDGYDSYECKEQDCHKGPDGRWVTNKLTARDGRTRDPVAYTRFFWRIEPNYCSYGKPFFSAEKIATIFKNSETKKVVLGTGRHSICLEWFKFDYPTENCWGLRQGPVHVTIYDQNKRIWTSKQSIGERGWRKEFKEFIEEYFKWDPNRKE